MCVHPTRYSTDRINDIESSPDKNFLSLIDDDLVLFDGECKYVEPNEAQILNGKNAELRVLHANIHSIPSKIGELKDLLETLKKKDICIDVILLCETFLNDFNKLNCQIDGYQLIEEHRITKSKGGVAAYINNKLRFKERNDLTIFKEGQFESCFVEIYCKERNVLVGEVYRVPSSNEKDFIVDYEALLAKFKKEKKDIIIGTDQNLDYLKINQHKNTATFLEVNLSSNLLPTVTKPTRITHSTATLIDNIYISSNISDNSTSCILLSDLSDHLPCLALIGNVKPENKGPLIFNTRKINEQSIQKMNEKLSQNNWNIVNQLNCNEGYDYILNSISTVLDEVSPSKVITIPYNKIIREPWMSQGLRNSAKQKEKLYKKCLGLDKDNPKHQAYRVFRNRYNSLKRSAKYKYYYNKILEFKKNSKKLWNFLKIMIGKKHDKSSQVDSILINGKMTFNPNLISNGFCNYFSNISINMAKIIPSSNKSYRDYLGNDTGDTLFFTPTNENEVQRCINSLPNKTSAGFDGISNIVLKGIAEPIKAPLSIIFNKSLVEGYFPDKMKIAEIIPAFKSKDKHLLSNYRPISLLPVISKVLERIVYKRLYSFLTQKQLLYESQYGFRNNHNTVQAVTELLGNILTGFEENNITVALFLDLSKAFDTLEHATLTAKLEHYGVRGTPLRWFTSYLHNRKHYVRYNNVKSEYNKEPMKYGVPQGSVLGPLLYLIFCNDLYKCIEKCKVIMFADDTTLYKTHRSLNYLIQCINHDFKILADWFYANKLSLNVAKTNYIVFRPKSMTLNLEDLKLNFGNETINRVDYTKFLGIFVDSHLNWNRHVEHVCSQLSKSLYILQVSKNQMPSWALRTLYYAYFHSHINYGLTLWGPMCTMSKSNRIVKSQKKAIRCIDSAQYNAPTNPLFKKYHMIKFPDIIDLELAKLGFLISKNMLPNPVQKLFRTGADFHNYNTRNRNNPVVSRHKSHVFNRSFMCRAPAVWTNLSYDLKNLNSLGYFSKKFKKLKVKSY